MKVHSSGIFLTDEILNVFLNEKVSNQTGMKCKEIFLINRINVHGQIPKPDITKFPNRLREIRLA